MTSANLVFLLVGLCTVASLHAQDQNAITRAQTDFTIRRWTVPIVSDPTPNVSAADAQQLTQHLAAIMSRVAKLPEFNAPPPDRCHSVEGAIDYIQAHAAVVRGRVVVESHQWLRDKCLVGARFPSASIAIKLNDPNLALRHWEDAAGRFYLWTAALPASGVTVYPSWIVITRSHAPPPLIHVNKERYLKVSIAEVEKELAEYNKTINTDIPTTAAKVIGAPTPADQYDKWLREGKPQMVKTLEESLKALREAGINETDIAAQRAKMQAAVAEMDKKYKENAARAPNTAAMNQAVAQTTALNTKLRDQVAKKLEGLRRQLAEMSPARRAEPVCEQPLIVEQFTPCTGDNSIVQFNPNYFDLSRPRSDVQLLIVQWGGVDPGSESGKRPGPSPALWGRLQDPLWLRDLVK